MLPDSRKQNAGRQKQEIKEPLSRGAHRRLAIPLDASARSPSPPAGAACRLHRAGWSRDRIFATEGKRLPVAAEILRPGELEEELQEVAGEGPSPLKVALGAAAVLLAVRFVFRRSK